MSGKVAQEEDEEEEQQQHSSSTSASTSSLSTNPSSPNVLFLHLDLGIGGAEQLMLQLALASQSLGHSVQLYTTRCDPTHCFDPVKPPNGQLCHNVHVVGSWIPASIGGKGIVICSTLRLLYVTAFVLFQQSKRSTRQQQSNNNNATPTRPTAIVLDGLPTPIPFLLSFFPMASILFYCHFPERLLVEQLQRHGRSGSNHNNNGGESDNNLSRLKTYYRRLFDLVEERTMGMADTLVVNSKFTLSKVQEVFPHLRKNSTNLPSPSVPERQEDYSIHVLYPALDSTHHSTTTATTSINKNHNKTTSSPIVSLNRYERKKKIDLVLRSYALFVKEVQQNSSATATVAIPPLIIAGGYDIRSIENVEYRAELQQLAEQELGLTVVPSISTTSGDPQDYIMEMLLQHASSSSSSSGCVQFLMDVSDTLRSHLFQTALCVVYTPPEEHFGIVPLEAMASGTPVVAVASGGPLETIVNDETGFLCAPTPQAFATALKVLYDNPVTKATTMGQVAREHVLKHFGMQRLTNEWKELVEATVQRGRTRNQQQEQKSSSMCLWINTSTYFGEAFLAILIVVLLTFLLRAFGLLQPHQSILGAVRSLGEVDEL